MNIPFLRSCSGRPVSGVKNDCAVIALSNALGISYFESENFLRAMGRKHNRGTYTQRIFGFKLNESKVILGHKIQLVFKHTSQLKKITYFNRGVKLKYVGISLNQFLLRRLPGVYMCKTRNHIFTIRDGVVLSAHPEKGRGILTDIWKVEKFNSNENVTVQPITLNTIKINSAQPVIKNKLEKFPWLNNYLE